MPVFDSYPSLGITDGRAEAIYPEIGQLLACCNGQLALEILRDRKQFDEYVGHASIFGTH
jgi:hypothetical protein